MEKSLIKLIEDEILAEDRDFYDELFEFRGVDIEEAQRQAWIDWAAEMVCTKFGADMLEAENRVIVLEQYYKEINFI